MSKTVKYIIQGKFYVGDEFHEIPGDDGCSFPYKCLKDALDKANAMKDYYIKHCSGSVCPGKEMRIVRVEEEVVRSIKVGK